MEKPPIEKEVVDSNEVFMRLLEEGEMKAIKMLNKQEAYYIDERDEKGKLLTLKILDSKTGEIIFFKDYKGLKDYNKKLSD